MSRFHEKKLRKFYKDSYSKFSGGLTSYRHIDAEWRVYTTASIVNSLDRPNLKYDITDPVTGIVYPHPEKGWTISERYYQELYDAGRIVFAGNRPRKKYFLKDTLKQKPAPVITETRSKAHNELFQIIGKNEYRYTKNVSVLKKWINIVSGWRDDILVMDFFAGSGSTGQAVLELNEDGGSREVLLMTNNENNIASEITVPRLENVISGEWSSGTVSKLSGVLVIDKDFLND